MTPEERKQNWREDRYGIGWQEGSTYVYRPKGYWKNAIIENGETIYRGEFVSYEDERRQQIEDRLQRIEDKLDRLLAGQCDSGSGAKR